MLRSIRVQNLARTARVAVRCAGRHCPRIRAHATGAAQGARLLRHLAGRRLKAGQSLLITVTARHLHPERIELRMRNGRAPLAKLLH